MPPLLESFYTTPRNRELDVSLAKKAHKRETAKNSGTFSDNRKTKNNGEACREDEARE